MTHFLAALVTLVLLWLSAAIARYVRPRLPETHRTRETIETMQLMITMLVTFAALVLGLLTASVKNSYDIAGRDRQGYALRLTQLDRCLRDYGSAADPIRELLKSYTAAVIASTWPSEPKPEGVQFPDTSRMARVGADPVLAGIMDQSEGQLRRLDPPDAFHAKLVAHCLSIFDEVLNAREAVIQDVGGRLSWPFYCILVFWLMVIFAAFGLAAPRNNLSLIAILLCAISLSSTIFVISELSEPYGGLLSIPSDAMRSALAHMTAPSGP